ncbi:MAG: DinB family protein [Candidatus Thorarchaeota archaeon]
MKGQSAKKTETRVKIVQLAEFLKEAVYGQLDIALKDIDDATLNWRPSPNSNSIGNLVVHIAGAESYWIHEVVGGMRVGRQREREFNHVQFSTNELLEEIRKIRNITDLVLEKLFDFNLEDSRRYWSDRARRDKETTVHWAILHVIEHSALHIGQIFYARKLYQSSKTGP